MPVNITEGLRAASASVTDIYRLEGNGHSLSCLFFVLSLLFSHFEFGLTGFGFFAISSEQGHRRSS